MTDESAEAREKSSLDRVTGKEACQELKAQLLFPLAFS
jgi:hypothetical protein